MKNRRNKTLTQICNAAIRSYKGLKGSKVTEIKLSNDLQTRIERTDYGYRKCTTGEYVPFKYRCNFGWKNTYYQSAKIIMHIGLVDQLLLGMIELESLAIDN
jgi:hypothetical protein